MAEDAQFPVVAEAGRGEVLRPDQHPLAGPPGVGDDRLGTLFGPLVLSPFQWQILVLVPVIGVVAGFIGLRLYERLLRRRTATAQGDPVSPPPD